MKKLFNLKMAKNASSYVQGHVNNADVTEIDQKKYEFVNLDELTKRSTLRRLIIKKQLSKQFAMKDLGAKVLSVFNMNEAKPVSTPLGSHFKLSKEHTKRRRKGPYEPTLHMQVGVFETAGYVDADFAGDIDSRKKAEYVAATEAGKEMIWLHGFLDELGKKQEMGILHSDSQSAIFLAKNSAFHSKSKHIQTKYHFIRYLVEDKLVILEKICGSKNPADMLTKGVTIEKLKLCAASIGLLA
ncbi:hypothetical protein AAG906_017201 [Vitis piasezkii]